MECFVAGDWAELQWLSPTAVLGAFHRCVVVFR